MKPTVQFASALRQAAMALTLGVALAIAAAIAMAQAQTKPWPDAPTLKTEIYFGLALPDGRIVSEADWNGFLNEVVVPRFPDGLTVIEAAGRSARAAADSGRINTTRILVVVHPNTDDAATRIGEVKAEYRKRFGSVGVFHTDAPVRIAPSQ